MSDTSHRAVRLSEKQCRIVARVAQEIASRVIQVAGTGEYLRRLDTPVGGQVYWQKLVRGAPLADNEPLLRRFIVDMRRMMVRVGGK